MAITIKDVAAKCGLSVATVSKALNQYGDVNEETRLRVQEAARELGYFPNAMARALKTSSTRLIGVLSGVDGAVVSPYAAGVLADFRREVEWHGYDLLLVTRNLGARPMTYLEHCRRRGVDGVLLLETDFLSTEIGELAASSLPLLTIDHVFQGRPCVACADRAGMSELVRHAVERGYRAIAYLHGPPNARTDNRLTGFYRACAQLRIESRGEWVRRVEPSDAVEVYRAVEGLLRGEPRPDCILLPEDGALYPAWRAVQDAGLRMPEEVSLAGFGGEAAYQAVAPRLTTVRPDMRRIGQEAARRLIESIEHPTLSGMDIVTVPGELLPGETIS